MMSRRHIDALPPLPLRIYVAATLFFFRHYVVVVATARLMPLTLC